MARPGATALARFVRDHRLALGYAGVVLLAALLRYTGLGFSASVPWGRPDEEIFAQIGMHQFGGETLRVSEGGWPELWYRVHHLMQRGLLAWWQLVYGEQIHLGCAYVLSPSRLLLPMRVFSATLGLATVLLVMRLGYLVCSTRLAPGQRHAVALASGLFYAVNVLAARDSHFAVTDQPLVFFMTWMFVATAQGIDRGYLRDFLSCGIALGLAIGTKWTGLTFAIVPVIALVVRFRRYGPTPANFGALLLGVIGFAGAFLVANPTFLHQPGSFISGIASIGMRYDPNAPRSSSIYVVAPIVLGIRRHALVSFPFALGWPLTLLAAVGAVASMTVWARRRGTVAFLVGFWTLFFYVAVVGRTTMYFARYSLPAHPTACVCAALVVVTAGHRLWERWTKGARLDEERAQRRAWALTAVVCVLALEPTFRAIEYVSILRQPDTREQAARWLHEHAGDTPIDFVGGYSRLLAVDDRAADVCEGLLPEGFAPPALRIAGAPNVSGMITERPATWNPFASEVVRSSLRDNVSRFTADWAVVTQPWLPCGQPVARYHAYDPPACYTEVARFEPEGIECDATYDDQDHFYAPLWGFTRGWWPSSETSARIGPSIVVYRRECDGSS